MTRVLVLTPGDPDGIGPEVTRKALRRISKLKKRPDVSFLVVGAPAAIKSIGRPYPEMDFIPAPSAIPRGLLKPGFQAGWSIHTAVDAIQRGWADALVTGPIHKERLQRGGYGYQGHTDFLADLSGVKDVTMCLTNSKLTVTLVTTHVPLSKVSGSVTAQRIERCILHTADYLKNFQGIQCPRIAVCGLNPHAGESGVLGQEEAQVIAPCLKRLQKRAKRSFILSGPHPSDTLFALSSNDAVVAMYHDQGLIPVKLLDFPNTVNVTLGLPFVRTSVDHGTAFDIAGKNVADESSMFAAIQLALDMIEKKSNA